MTDVSAVGGSTPAPSQAAPDIFGGLGPDAFLKLLVTQMRYQNPLSPSDPTAMMGQLASYAQVESLQNLQKGQAASATLTEAKLASDLVGRFVDAADAAGTTVSGTVVAARFTADGPVLVLDNGGELTLSAITRVGTSPAPPTPPAPAPAPQVPPPSDPPEPTTAVTDPPTDPSTT
jgi:flagellar basal-body rod modification protein FlgD